MDEAEFKRKLYRLQKMAVDYGVHESIATSKFHEFLWRRKIWLKPPIVAPFLNTAVTGVVLTIAVCAGVAGDAIVNGELSVSSLVLLGSIAYVPGTLCTISRFLVAKRLGWPRWEDL